MGGGSDADGGGGQTVGGGGAAKGRARPKTSGGPRKRVRWSAAEEDYLRQGVARYKNSQNMWALIRDKFPFEEGRTNVDLKDKWRNMEKAGTA